MSIQAHLAELERRHRALEAELNEARAHPSIDDLEIVELKRRKLLVKDEIALLQLDTVARGRERKPCWFGEGPPFCALSAAAAPCPNKRLSREFGEETVRMI